MDHDIGRFYHLLKPGAVSVIFFSILRHPRAPWMTESVCKKQMKKIGLR